MARPIWDDPRVRGGMQRQLQTRRARLERGERPLGWKLGFGSERMQAVLDIDAPVLGFLTSESPTDSVAGLCAGLANPYVEPELVVHVGPALAVEGLSAGVEVVDLGAL